MSLDEVEEYYPKTKQHLRRWLEKNHSTKNSVWLIFHKKDVGKSTMKWSDAVDEDLCFRWIDSKARLLMAILSDNISVGENPIVRGVK